jgi:hypothetical protein
MEKALKAVCITVFGSHLHCPANRPDLKRIEQTSGIVKGSINGEQYNTPEELSVQAQTE